MVVVYPRAVLWVPWNIGLIWYSWSIVGPVEYYFDGSGMPQSSIVAPLKYYFEGREVPQSSIVGP